MLFPRTQTAWQQLIYQAISFFPCGLAKNVCITIFKPCPLHTSFREVTDTVEVLEFLERLGFLIPFGEEVGVAP